MSSYPYLNTRQIINNDALSNVGSPANDTLDDILNKINNALASVSGGKGYAAQAIALTSGLGTTSYAAIIPSQPDSSYVVLAMFENDTDPHPQFQQIEVTSKSLTGFTFSWNSPLESNNYIINFIILPIVTTKAEVAVPDSVSSEVIYLNVPQNGPNYGIIASMQNLVDTNPQFQTPVITNQSETTFTEDYNAKTMSSHYQLVYMANPTAQVAIAEGASSITVISPKVAYGSTGYAAIASISNVTDTNLEIQPVIITNKSGSNMTFSWNTPTPTTAYLLTYIAISLILGWGSGFQSL